MLHVVFFVVLGYGEKGKSLKCQPEQQYFYCLIDL